MAGTFKFELVSPERVLMSEDAEQVILMGTEGQFTVLPGHSSMISTLRPGILEVTIKGRSRRIYVRGGFAEVEPDRLTVLKGAVLESETAAANAMLSGAKTDEARRLAQAAVDTLRGFSR
jgi:F-type H+-transporting ATPase subunit epsilon